VWRMYFDGSLKLQGVGSGIVFIALGGEQLKYALQLLFLASNNAAEYEALIHGLNIAISLGIKLSHPVLEGKPNANHVRARIRNSRTQRLHK
jgi:ribonuclease HI